MCRQLRLTLHVSTWLLLLPGLAFVVDAWSFGATFKPSSQALFRVSGGGPEGSQPAFSTERLPAPSPETSTGGGSEAATSSATPAHAACSDEKRVRRMAVAFYGLTRSLNHTIDSIHTNIFAPLVAAGIEYDVYLHTYDLETLRNERTGEDSVLNTTEWKLLRPDFQSVTSQDAFLEEFERSRKACRVQGDPLRDGFKSLTNHFCELNSLHLVTRLWRSARRPYDAVMYLRPDVLYNCPLPVARLHTLPPDTLLVPDFHHGLGWNDRFVVAQPMAAAMWGDRLHYTFATCQEHPIRPEENVKLLAEHHDLTIALLDFHFLRVRSNGLVEPQDLAGALGSQGSDKAMDLTPPTACYPTSSIPLLR